MVGLNPVLRFLISVEESLARGDGVRDGIVSWIGAESDSTGEFQSEILEFLRKTEANGEKAGDLNPSEICGKTLYRQSLMTILLDGIRGGSILPRLRELRTEIEAQLELDMRAHVESLPLKMLVPLLLFMFPAFLILLLGPITQNFVEALIR